MKSQFLIGCIIAGAALSATIKSAPANALPPGVDINEHVRITCVNPENRADVWWIEMASTPNEILDVSAKCWLQGGHTY